MDASSPFHNLAFRWHIVEVSVKPRNIQAEAAVLLARHLLHITVPTLSLTQSRRLSTCYSLDPSLTSFLIYRLPVELYTSSRTMSFWQIDPPSGSKTDGRRPGVAPWLRLSTGPITIWRPQPSRDAIRLYVEPESWEPGAFTQPTSPQRSIVCL
ncbi:hypothetical protein LZ30DRAFT_208369 [Colletotrichum cereale]|nr:hypothetical protein LZ30DRAFT_208369 [Colletotrichum cereale]